MVTTAVPPLLVFSQSTKGWVSVSSAADVSVPSSASRRHVQLPAVSHVLVRMGRSRVSFGSTVLLPLLPAVTMLPPVPMEPPVLPPLPPVVTIPPPVPPFSSPPSGAGAALHPSATRIQEEKE